MRKTQHVILLFLDGVGIGRKDSLTNPFFRAEMPTLKNILGGEMPHLGRRCLSGDSFSLVPLSATLGVSGLPQSGTGQTALVTGVNAASVAGRHFGPYPCSSIKPLLREKNIFRQIKSAGRKGFYANAFPRQYFQYMASHRRSTAINLSWTESGGSLCDAEALESGEALSADITNERWHRLGYETMEVITPHEAGRRLGGFGKKCDFVLFEYFYTDHAGHSRSMEESLKVLGALDGLIQGIMSVFDGESMLLIMTSDHGNLEDLSTKSHTRNPVPLLALGHKHREITAGAKSLTHVTPAIMKLLM